MADELFRKEALKARRERWLGTVRMPVPRIGWWLSGTAVAFIVAVVAALTLGSYTRHVSIPGRLVPDGGTIEAKAPGQGKVLRILAEAGTSVIAGTPLLEISGEQESLSLGNTRELIASQLAEKRERLQRDIDNVAALGILQSADLDGALSSLRQNSGELNRQIDLQEQRSANASTLLEKWSGQATSGVVSGHQILQQQDVVLQMKYELSALKQRRLDVLETIRRKEFEARQLPIAMDEKTNAIQRELASLERELSENEVERAYVVSAPASGIVTNLLVHVGEFVSASQSLATVVAKDAELRAELWAPSRAIGMLDVGAPVLLRYDAFPYRQYGRQGGRVVEVARSASLPAATAALLGKDVPEPLFRVVVSLDEPEDRGGIAREHLLPGMTLEADVKLEKRRVVDWFL